MLRSLQHVALTVPNLEAGRKFYSSMGMSTYALGNDLVVRCQGRAQDQVRLSEGPRRRLHHVSFGTSAYELPAVQQGLECAGVKLVDAPVRDAGEGIWFRDVDGDLINVQAAIEAPQTRPPVALNNAGDFRRLGRRGAPDRNIEATPRRLGHLLKFTPDVERTARFYIDTLGMKLSDRIVGLAAFLRFSSDSDHHVLAIAKSDHTGLHHMSFELGNVDQIQLLAERMIEGGYKDGWGFGRHIYGSNYFHYIRDPWNGLVEYFWDIDHIPGGAAWEPEDAEAGPEALYQWVTSPPPADFLTNYEVH